jgi:hypothetical protein
MKIPQGKLKTEMLYIKILKKKKYKKNVLKLSHLVAETMSKTMVMAYAYSDAGGGVEEADDGSRWL